MKLNPYSTFILYVVGYKICPMPTMETYAEIFSPNSVRSGHDDDNKVTNLIVR